MSFEVAPIFQAEGIQRNVALQNTPGGAATHLHEAKGGHFS
jgi:hypothetical protein